MSQNLNIDVYFDLICPWCLIGKRHQASAVKKFGAARPDIRPHVVWRSFPLLPDTPLAGLPYQEFYERRLGGSAAVATRRAQVREAGRLAGVRFAFDDIAVMPNTLAAHALIAQVAAAGDDARTDRLIDALFQAYFTGGMDIGDLAALVRIAGDCGIPVDPRQLAAEVTPGAQNGGGGEVPGVPHFVFNCRLALSGSQPPETLLATMVRSLDEILP